jgi:type IV secretory pathway VirB10-like protein
MASKTYCEICDKNFCSIYSKTRHDENRHEEPASPYDPNHRDIFGKRAGSPLTDESDDDEEEKNKEEKDDDSDEDYETDETGSESDTEGQIEAWVTVITEAKEDSEDLALMSVDDILQDSQMIHTLLTATKEHLLVTYLERVFHLKKSEIFKKVAQSKGRLEKQGYDGDEAFSKAWDDRKHLLMRFITDNANKIDGNEDDYDNTTSIIE